MENQNSLLGRNFQILAVFVHLYSMHRQATHWITWLQRLTVRANGFEVFLAIEIHLLIIFHFSIFDFHENCRNVTQIMLSNRQIDFDGDFNSIYD